jgi:hypothetical protein
MHKRVLELDLRPGVSLDLQAQTLEGFAHAASHDTNEDQEAIQ